MTEEWDNSVVIALSDSREHAKEVVSRGQRADG